MVWQEKLYSVFKWTWRPRIKVKQNKWQMLKFHEYHWSVLLLDIKECDTNPCGENEKCLEQEGSYQCDCKNGFSSNGTHCLGNTRIFSRWSIWSSIYITFQTVEFRNHNEKIEASRPTKWKSEFSIDIGKLFPKLKTSQTFGNQYINDIISYFHF